MSAQSVTLEEFWCVLCDARTVRLSRYTAARGTTVYRTAIPPEDVPGFMERQIDAIGEALALGGRMLNRCAQCGGEPVYECRWGGWTWGFRCTGCPVSGPSRPTLKMAADAWNHQEKAG